MPTDPDPEPLPPTTIAEREQQLHDQLSALRLLRPSAKPAPRLEDLRYTAPEDPKRTLRG